MPSISSTGLVHVEGVVITLLVVGGLFWVMLKRFGATRPALHVGRPVAVAYAARLAAIAGISATGLESTLRGGDETTYLNLAQFLAQLPLGSSFLPHKGYQLQTILFALETKLGFMSVGAMRIVQVGITMIGMILIVVAVNDLAGPRAARIAAWVLALEPTTIFFDSALYKDPNMDLAAGLVVFGGTMIWRRLDVRGIIVCALGGAIAVETRSYAGWFLVSAAVLILLHAAIRHIDRPLRAMPVIYAVVIAGFLVAPVLMQASSKKNLQSLQVSQTANATGAGQGSGGANASNLALEKVDFSTRGAILTNLPKRIRDLILKPYPWQLGDSSQRFGAIGTLFSYVVLLLLIRFAWMSRGEILPRAAPLLYPIFFLLIAYSLSVGNAGTGFRYRTHLTILAVAATVILREVARRRKAQATALANPPKPEARARSAAPAAV